MVGILPGYLRVGMEQETEDAAIRAVITDYLEGMIWGDVDRLLRAFHPGSITAGEFHGVQYLTGRDAFIPEWLGLGSLPPGTPYEAEIQSVEVTGNLAVVKLWDRCFGDSYTDYLTLMHNGDRWQIISKAYYVHPETHAPA